MTNYSLSLHAIADTFSCTNVYRCQCGRRRRPGHATPTDIKRLPVPVAYIVSGAAAAAAAAGDMTSCWTQLIHSIQSNCFARSLAAQKHLPTLLQLDGALTDPTRRHLITTLPRTQKQFKTSSSTAHWAPCRWEEIKLTSYCCYYYYYYYHLHVYMQGRTVLKMRWNITYITSLKKVVFQ